MKYIDDLNNNCSEGSCCSSNALRLDRGPSAYPEYKTLVSSITQELKFNPIEFEIKDIQVNYLNPILKYINESLVLCESDDVYDKIYSFVDSVEEMDNLILNGDTAQISFLLGFNKCMFELVPFTMLWTYITTAMKIKLDYNYGWRSKFRSQLSKDKCPCGCNCSECPCCYCNGTESSQLENLYSGRPIQDCYYSASQGYKERW